MRVDNMGQAAMCEIGGEGRDKILGRRKSGMAEAISGQGCKVQGDGVRQEDEHLPESTLRRVSEKSLENHVYD